MILLLLLAAATTLPAAEYSAFIGDENTWHVSRLLVDASGNTYVAGSRTFNLSMNPLTPDLASEAIVAKLDNTGKRVLFAGIGGKGNDVANAVAVDGQGNIYIAGSTTSPNFPVRNALYPAPLPGFITKYNPNATDVIYSTYFPERITGMAVDAEGGVYVTGTTWSRSFPVTPGLPAGPVGGSAPMITAAFLTKLSPAGDRIVYSTLISGQEKLCGAGSSCFTSSRGAASAGIAVDAAGNAYLAGNSDVVDLPVTPGVVTPNGAGPFVARINAAGSGLAYLTYLGTGRQAYAPVFIPASRVAVLAVDAAGNAYVAGSTFDPHLPVTPGAYQMKFDGWAEIDNFATPPPTDAFAMKLNPTGTAVLWGSYLGGDGTDAATAGAVDAAGNFWVSGNTASTGFPDANGWSTGNDFIVEFNSSGGLPYSARYPAGTASLTLGVDPAGLLHVATETGVVSAVAASAHPAVRPWVLTNAAGGPLAGQVSAGEVIAIYGPHIGAFPAVAATGAGGRMPTTLGSTQVFVNDIPAPLLYSSDGQINAVVPFGVAGQTRARIRVMNQDVSGPEFDAAVLPAIPMAFAPALNQDGTINSADNPAKPGSVVSVWVTGVTPPFPAVPDGQIAAGAQTYLVGQLYAGQLSLFPQYAGFAPGLVAGIAQINFAVPASGTVTLAVGNYATTLGVYVAQ